MNANDKRPSPSGKEPGRFDRHPDASNNQNSTDTVARGLAPVTDLADWRQLKAWTAAAKHLNALGLSAAVPAGLVLPLRRRGFDVWAARSDWVA